jgi:hypothetical protein
MRYIYKQGIDFVRIMLRYRRLNSKLRQRAFRVYTNNEDGN